MAKGSSCLHACMCTTCVPAGPGSQQRVSEPLEQLVWPIMRHMWVLRSEPRSSERAAITFNHWVESCLSSSNTFAFSKVSFLGWEDSSVGKTFSIQAKRTWVQIPRIPCKKLGMAIYTCNFSAEEVGLEIEMGGLLKSGWVLEASLALMTKLKLETDS